MEIGDIISKKVSFQSNAWSSLETEVSIGEVIKNIKHGKYSFEVDKLRYFLRNNEKEKYDIYKKRLPGVTFCANFEKTRKKEHLKEYHSIVVIDIDKLEKEELLRVKEILKNDNFVFTYWLSPSEKGIKGLVYLKYEFDISQLGIDSSHKIAFQQLTDYFDENFSIYLDTSGSDTTRLCFLSYDPELIFKNEITPFIVELKEDIIIEKDVNNPPKRNPLKIKYLNAKDTLYNPKGKNNQKDKKTIIKIIKYLKDNNLSITNSYEEWYRVAFAVANTFTYDIGEKFYLNLCVLDGSRYDEIQSRNMLLYCYNNNKKSINFNTITFLAKDKGFKI